jgi:hypothetical protein
MMNRWIMSFFDTFQIVISPAVWARIAYLYNCEKKHFATGFYFFVKEVILEDRVRLGRS